MALNLARRRAWPQQRSRRYPCDRKRWARMLARFANESLLSSKARTLKFVVSLALLTMPALAINDPYVAPSAVVQIAACITWSGQPVGGEQVYYTTYVTAGSGYHDHNAGRPPGSFNTPSGQTSITVVTSSDGCAYVYWYAPQAAGSHDIVGIPAIGAPAYLSFIVWAFTDRAPFVEMPSGSDYSLTGQTGDHLSNHWGTGNANARLQTIFSQFRAQTGAIGQINDQSLGWGGTFDLGPAYASASCPSYASQYWTNTCNHGEHRYGRNADIPFAGLGGQGPAFLDIATRNDGAGGGPILDEGNHYHLRFGS